MANKIFLCIAIIALVVFTYVILLAMQPATNAIIETANASANWTGAEDAQGLMTSFPLWQWLIPGFVGLVGLVGVWLKS